MKPKARPKVIVMWFIVDPENRLKLVARMTKKAAQEAWSPANWHNYKAIGYRAVKCKVVPL